MIPLDKLKSIKHLCTHASCPDGVASALIIKDALPDVKVSFMLYGTKEHRELVPEPGMLFCDFTPYIQREMIELRKGVVISGAPLPESLKPWLDAGTLVLDHHPTAKDIVEAFGENGVFGENDKNECGAWLAYEHVWRPLCELRDELVSENYPMATSQEVERFARLAAIRDTWKKDDPYWLDACQQAAELVFWGFDVLVLRGSLTSGQVAVPKYRTVGTQLLDKQLAAAQRSIGEAHRFTTTTGVRVLMFQGVSTTSDAAEMLERGERLSTTDWEALGKAFKHYLEHKIGTSKEELEKIDGKPITDLVVGFHYKVDAKLQLQFSTRSHTGYDCAAFAKAHGGGGHRAAAGFTVEVSPEVSVNPYQTFRLLLEEWEAAR